VRLEEGPPAVGLLRTNQVRFDAVAMLPTMLEQDRKRAGWSVGEASWQLGVTVREYRELEAGERWPNWETFHRSACYTAGPRRFGRRLLR
jgi:hypothetical protein